VYGIGSIIPNKGAIIVQAMSNNNAHDMGRKAIIAGHSAEEIIEALQEKRFYPKYQQYAVVTLKDLKAIAYTGDGCMANKGILIGKGLSVQGNILENENVLKAVYDTAIKGQNDGLPIQEILMQALEAGSRAGGDKRCGTIQTASSAFIEVAKPNDDPQKPTIKIVVRGIQKGGENAVDMLRREFENWKKQN
jgi:uncharacterized Ntn-hydrolase superfamily protein